MENIYEGGIHQISVKPVKTCFIGFIHTLTNLLFEFHVLISVIFSKINYCNFTEN